MVLHVIYPSCQRATYHTAAPEDAGRKATSHGVKRPVKASAAPITWTLRCSCQHGSWTACLPNKNTPCGSAPFSQSLRIFHIATTKKLHSRRYSRNLAYLWSANYRALALDHGVDILHVHNSFRKKRNHKIISHNSNHYKFV